jgi:hypothetical protein
LWDLLRHSTLHYSLSPELPVLSPRFVYLQKHFVCPHIMLVFSFCFALRIRTCLTWLEHISICLFLCV